LATFEYHPDILIRYPNTVGGIILAQGLTNGPSSVSLKTNYAAEQQAVLKRIGSTPLSQLPSIAAWRNIFSSFGVEPTKYRSAPEALLRRLTKKGDIPTINTLVDLGNLVSIRYALPVAIFDIAQTQGKISVHFADTSERFTPLGETGLEHPEAGEVIFADATGLVMSRRWCWRQSQESSAQPSTTSAIITVEAQHPNAHSEVEAALHNLLQLLQEHSTGTFKYGILDKDQPSLTNEG
jgi:DNA/RNA-binding domain of Phe-tRNA-synthetase-like protein